MTMIKKWLEAKKAYVSYSSSNSKETNNEEENKC